MAYEVEVRAQIKNNNQWNECKNKLEELGKLISHKKLNTWLFPDGERCIRITGEDGKEGVKVTFESGVFEEETKKEIEKELSRNQKNSFPEIMSRLGWGKYAFLQSERFTYETEEMIKVDLTDYSNMGKYVEVEIVVDDKNAISLAEYEAGEFLESLGLEELDPVEYQKQMDQMYEKTLKPVEVSIEKRDN